MELGVISPPNSPTKDVTRISKNASYIDQQQEDENNEIENICKVDDNDSCSIQSFHSFKVYNSVGVLCNDNFSMQSTTYNDYQYNNVIKEDKNKDDEIKIGINENYKEIGIILF